jgi:hypothetical protein
MKTLKTAFTIISVYLLFAFCNPNKSKIVAVEDASENPFSEFLVLTGLNKPTAKIINGTSYETGFSFKPTVNGSLNELIVTIPNTNNNLKIIIWDKTTQQPIRSELMNVTASNLATIKKITPLHLQENKEYTITMRTNDFYIRNNIDFSKIHFPIQVHSIEITEAYMAHENKNENPITSNYGFFGDVSFTFNKTEN